MPEYIRFPTADGGTMLVEVEGGETVTSTRGISKAGLKERVTDSVAAASSTFESAVADTVRRNVAAVTDAIDGLVTKPSDIQVSFGLKATGELGNFAIAKVNAEASITLTLTWKTPPA